MVNIKDIMFIPLIRKIILEYAYPTEKQLNIWRHIHKQKNSWMKFTPNGCPTCLFLNMQTVKQKTIWIQFFARKIKDGRYPFCLYINN